MRKEWRKGERGKENKEQAGVFLGSFRKGYMWMLRIWKRIPFTCPCLPPGLHKSSSEIFWPKELSCHGDRWHLFCLHCSRKTSLVKRKLQILDVLNIQVWWAGDIFSQKWLSMTIEWTCILHLLPHLSSGFSIEADAGLVHESGISPWRFHPSLWSRCSKSVC